MIPIVLLSLLVKGYSFNAKGFGSHNARDGRLVYRPDSFGFQAIIETNFDLASYSACCSYDLRAIAAEIHPLAVYCYVRERLLLCRVLVADVENSEPILRSDGDIIAIHGHGDTSYIPRVL